MGWFWFSGWQSFSESVLSEFFPHGVWWIVEYGQVREVNSLTFVESAGNLSKSESLLLNTIWKGTRALLRVRLGCCTNAEMGGNCWLTELSYPHMSLWDAVKLLMQNNKLMTKDSAAGRITEPAFGVLFWRNTREAFTWKCVHVVRWSRLGIS